MEYVLPAQANGTLPASNDHRALHYKVLITPVMRRSWAEITCSCGKTSRGAWSAGTVTFLGVVALAWLDGCGKDAYVATSGISSEVLP